MCLDVIGLGFLVGLLQGGWFTNLGRMPIRGLGWFVFLGAIQAVLHYAHAPEQNVFYQALIIASMTVMVGLLWANRHMPGVWLIVVGLLLNFVVMGANGGLMPVSEWAAIASGQGQYLSELAPGTGSRHVLMTSSTRLKLLGDVIPIMPPYPIPRVLSIGDLIVFAGIIRLIVWGMLAGPRQKWLRIRLSRREV